MKKHIRIFCFLALNILVFLIFTPWLKGHYATDSYNIINVGYDYYSIHNSLVDGRIFMFLIMQFAKVLNIDFKLLHFILLALALIISNISVMIIKNLCLDIMKTKNIKSIIFSYIIAFTFIYNFTYIENLYFLECFVMAMAILLNLMAAKIYAQKGRLCMIKTTLLLILSIFCYQGTISSFIVFIILLEALKSQNIKSFIKNISLALIPIGIACICNFAFVKLISTALEIKQTRISGSIFKNILYILIKQPFMIINLSNCYFNGMFLIFLTMLIMLFIYSFNYKDNKSRYLIFFVFIVLGSIICTNLPYLISLSSFEAARTRLGIGALLSIIIIYIIKNSSYIENKEKKFVKHFICIITIVYFLLNVFNYITIIEASSLVNVYEKEYVENINEYITKYEEKNKVTVEKIQLVCNNEFYSNAYFDNLKKVPFITWNACLCSWSAIGTINFYSNRNLAAISTDIIKAPMDKLYEIKDNVLYLKIAIP